MIHVLITVKPSVRFPGKNKRLFPYTAIWLHNEIANTEEAVRVYTVGERSELPEKLPTGWIHLDVLTGSHKGDVVEAERLIHPDRTADTLILLQVTQPLRRCGLLADMVKAAHGGEEKSAVSAALCEGSNWRFLTCNGKWDGFKTHSSRSLRIDGACYAWRPGYAEAIFDANVPHATVQNLNMICDIDYEADIPLGINAIWAETVLN